MKLNRFRMPSITVLLAVGGAIACGDPDHQVSHQDTASIQAPTAVAERLDIPHEVEVYGTVTATRAAAVSVRVMAMVTAVHVRDGDRVPAGQLLVEIDPQTTEGQVAQARGALSQAQAALALAKRNYERFQALTERHAASELELDMARMQFEQAAGAVEQAEGAVAAASSVAGDTRVVAPFPGLISRKMIELGDLAAPGRPLMMIESERGRRLVVTIPESILQESAVAIGDLLRVRIDSRDDLGVLEAEVTELSPGADPASHSVQAKLELPVDDLTTGAAGRAWIATRPRSAVAVPQAAVIHQGGLSLVVVRTSAGLASTRVVTLGTALADERVEVLSGLSGGETVLTGLAAAPPAGTRVEPRS